MESKRFGLLGYPLGHSLSPLIHKEVMALCGVKGEYNLYETPRESFENGIEGVMKNLNGFNVTIPYKTDILPFIDKLCGEAALMETVNTVKIENGALSGYNTDCTGFLRSLEGAGMKIGKSVLICGSGGVSRMFAFVCAERGAEVTLAVRPSGLERAKKLKAEIEIKLGVSVFVTTLDEVNKGYSLIVNGTPAGMYPDNDSSPLKKEAVLLSEAVFDAVYNPAETKLLSYAKEGGLKYVNGLPMLVWQAAAAQEIWNGIAVKKEDIQRITELCEKELKG